jgi:hypothetical protein
VSADADFVISRLDRAERRKRRGQIAASVVLVATGAAFLAVPLYPMRVIGVVFVALGGWTFVAVRRAELARAGHVRSLLRADPDGIAWIWSDVRRPNLGQSWVVFHCRDGRVYTALALADDAREWLSALRRRCPQTLITLGTPSPAMREAWRKNPRVAPASSAPIAS